MADRPFLISACALAYGDPFYAVNLHAKFYRSPGDRAWGFQDADELGRLLAHGLDAGPPGRDRLHGPLSRPIRSANKWHGLDYVSPWLARALEAASLAGLVKLFLRLGAGPAAAARAVRFPCCPTRFTAWPIAGGAEWCGSHRGRLSVLPDRLAALVPHARPRALGGSTCGRGGARQRRRAERFRSASTCDAMRNALACAAGAAADRGLQEQPARISSLVTPPAGAARECSSSPRRGSGPPASTTT